MLKCLPNPPPFLRSWFTSFPEGRWGWQWFSSPETRSAWGSCLMSGSQVPRLPKEQGLQKALKPCHTLSPVAQLEAHSPRAVAFMPPCHPAPSAWRPGTQGTLLLEPCPAAVPQAGPSSEPLRAPWDTQPGLSLQILMLQGLGQSLRICICRSNTRVILTTRTKPLVGTTPWPSCGTTHGELMGSTGPPTHRLHLMKGSYMN